MALSRRSPRSQAPVYARRGARQRLAPTARVVDIIAAAIAATTITLLPPAAPAGDGSRLMVGNGRRTRTPVRGVPPLAASVTCAGHVGCGALTVATAATRPYEYEYE